MKKIILFSCLFIVTIFSTTHVYAEAKLKTTDQNILNQFIRIDADSLKSIQYEYEYEVDDLYKEKEQSVAVFSNNNNKRLSNEDIYLMAQIVYAESRSEPFEGQLAVAAVILNRLEHPAFPDTIEGVIKQKAAFSCVKNGEIHVKPNKNSYKAVTEALAGKDPTKNAVFFYNPKIATNKWMKNIEKVNLKTIGNHVFFVAK